ELIVDVAYPTHGLKLTIRTRKGAPGTAGPPPRVIAVRKDLGGAAITMLPPLGGHYGGNIALPGKGAYRLLVRLQDPSGKRQTAKFDITY
ncbi:MAG: iron transporter, partial [Candidatus Sericytochromatia bacterium]|nr:iron transporter [Candidatus Tanganyikabacteria bacterium]